MIKTIIIIIVSVAIVGILFFILVKNVLKKRLEYLSKGEEKK